MPQLARREVCAMNKAKARRHLIQTCRKTGSISDTARVWNASSQPSARDFTELSRAVVRKWVNTLERHGVDGLRHRPGRPPSLALHRPAETQQQRFRAWQETHYPLHGLALHVTAKKLSIFPPVFFPISWPRPTHTPKPDDPLGECGIPYGSRSTTVRHKAVGTHHLQRVGTSGPFQDYSPGGLVTPRSLMRGAGKRARHGAYEARPTVERFGSRDQTRKLNTGLSSFSSER